MGAEARALRGRLLEAQQEAEREAKREAAAEAARLAAAEREAGRWARAAASKARELAAAAVAAAAAAVAAADALERAMAADGGGGGSSGAAGPSEVGEAAAAAVPDDYICPITAEIMTDPVSTLDGFTYERAAITEWLRTKDTSPKTGATLESKILIPNYNHRSMIRAFNEARAVAAAAPSPLVVRPSAAPNA